MKIVLVRHGEVEKRYKGCYNGHIDIGLSKQGYLDAQNLKNQLKTYNFDAIYCSDLLRAKETLKQITDAQNVVYSPDLREKCWGDYEGMSYDEIVKSTNIRYKDFKSWIDALGGESVEEFCKRVDAGFSKIKKLNKKCVLVVTHSGVIKSFIASVRGISLEEAFSLALPYGSVAIYESDTKEVNIWE